MQFNSDTHTYTVNGKELQSVSKWIEQFVPEFPAQMIAAKIATKQDCPIEDILDKWELKKQIALHQGNFVHDSIQYYLKYDKDFTNEPIEAFKEHETDNQYYSEVIVHDDELAGTIDLIEVVEKGKVKLHDFKTNADLYKKQGMMLGEYFDWDNTPFNRYTLQLNKYQELLEKMKDIEVVEKNLWHYKQGKFEVINIEL